MKKLMIKIALSAILMLTIILPEQLSAQTTKNFTINGSLTGMMPMPSKVYLMYDAVIEKPIDSAMVKNNKYTFKGNVEASVIATITLTKTDTPLPKDKLNVMLDNGILDITSDQSLSNAIVTGSSTTAHTEFLKITSFAVKESAAIQAIMQSEAYKTDESLKKEITSRSTNLLGNSLVNIIKYIRKNPSSPVSPYFTYTMIASGYVTPEMSDTLYQSFPASLKSAKLGLAIAAVFAKRKQAALDALAKRKALDELTPVGAKAKDFTQNDVNDQPISLSSFRGKYVLVDFWASWCAPCRAENPNLVKAYTKYKNKGFNILGVSLDSKNAKQAWINAIAKDGLVWTQVSDLKSFENEAAVLYGIKAIPQNFLIDPNGVIVAKNLRGEALEEKLNEIFK
ncbi:AhpC/TSA family protein [Pedobacter hiemivivus]|uniref:AhpC/TSA family protein n=1 Tax=Pedobacter hiemivivus TaxID=2530454 RepID=A0A4V5PDA7_9SPHI|nr:TlpA disulfide reductase family protein [Pedobacter hiemivivus]TKC63696.1 AhpC/TSA family protein [Pedobacter hiemivivus]